MLDKGKIMNKKLMLLGLTAGVLFCFSPALHAQSDFSSMADIDTILEENTLREVFARYTSMLVFFQPEEATRLGLNAGNGRLNDRSVQADTQMLQALESVRTSLKAMDPKNLSEAKRADYHLLQADVERNIWKLQQNRLTTDPLYYTQAFDAVYDLFLEPQTDSNKIRTDLLNRISYLPQVYEQARQNLTLISPQVAQVAMEKAYYAYLSFDTVTDTILNGKNLANDSREMAEIDHILSKAKNSLNDFFVWFKQLSTQPAQITSGIGQEAYQRKLQTYYQIDLQSAQLIKELASYLDQAQHQLFNALRPFELSADEGEVTLVEDLNNRPQEKLAGEKSKADIPYVPPTANQFYAIANQLVSPFNVDQLMEQFVKQTTAQSSSFALQTALLGATPVTIRELPAYFAYRHEFITHPANSVFWMRLPAGNELAKTQMLNQDFNEPATKLLISSQIMPGRYYQSLVQKNEIRRLLGSPTLANGWTLYALHMAQEKNIFLTDEEILFATWERFIRALSAVVDYRLHTQQYSYADALAFLTDQNGFTQQQATLLVQNILSQPGEAVSYLVGEEYWNKAAHKSLKKTKDADRTNTLLLEMGNVSPNDMSKELKRIQGK